MIARRTPSRQAPLHLAYLLIPQTNIRYDTVPATRRESRASIFFRASARAGRVQAHTVHTSSAQGKDLRKYARQPADPAGRRERL